MSVLVVKLQKCRKICGFRVLQAQELFHMYFFFFKNQNTKISLCKLIGTVHREMLQLDYRVFYVHHLREQWPVVQSWFQLLLKRQNLFVSSFAANYLLYLYYMNQCLFQCLNNLLRLSREK